MPSAKAPEGTTSVTGGLPVGGAPAPAKLAGGTPSVTGVLPGGGPVAPDKLPRSGFASKAELGGAAAEEGTCASIGAGPCGEPDPEAACGGASPAVSSDEGDIVALSRTSLGGGASPGVHARGTPTPPDGSLADGNGGALPSKRGPHTASAGDGGGARVAGKGLGPGDPGDGGGARGAVPSPPIGDGGGVTRGPPPRGAPVGDGRGAGAVFGSGC